MIQIHRILASIVMSEKTRAGGGEIKAYCIGPSQLSWV